MKNSAKHLFFFTLLLLGSAFTRLPVPAETAMRVPAGGAYVVFAGKFGGEVSQQEIGTQTEVQVEGCAKGARIFDFTLAITRNGKTSTLTGRSNVLTSDMRTQLQSLTKGDAFEFRNTKAYLVNSKDVVDVHARKFMVV